MDTITPGQHLERTITVALKDVYGITKIYPVCERARTFAALTGQKTLSDRHIEIIKGLGYTIVIEQRILP
jgi:hypothetical protein